MTWEDFKRRKLPIIDISICRTKVDVDCPRCGKHLWKRLDMVLTSNPPKYQYECDCGWTGYHTV